MIVTLKFILVILVSRRIVIQYAQIMFNCNLEVLQHLFVYKSNSNSILRYFLTKSGHIAYMDISLPSTRNL
jgi:hypothetical protein